MVNSTRKSDQKTLGDEQVENQTNNIAGQKFGKLSLDGALVLSCKRPAPVPVKAIDNAENEANRLANKPWYARSQDKKKFQEADTNNSTRRANDAEFDEL